MQAGVRRDYDGLDDGLMMVDAMLPQGPPGVLGATTPSWGPGVHATWMGRAKAGINSTVCDTVCCCLRRAVLIWAV